MSNRTIRNVFANRITKSFSILFFLLVPALYLLSYFGFNIPFIEYRPSYVITLCLLWFFSFIVIFLSWWVSRRIISVLFLMSVAFLLTSFALSFPSIPSFVGHFFQPQKRWHRETLRRSIELKRIDNAFLRFFGRDPVRVPPNNEDIIVSPADGYVRAILQNSDSVSIVIGMRVYDVHVNYFPLSGKIIDITEDGIEVTDISYKEYSLNYRSFPLDGIFDVSTKYGKAYRVTTTMETLLGTVRVHQITNWWARRIKVYRKVGDEVRIGDKLGRVFLGSTVVLDLPRRNIAKNRNIKLYVEATHQDLPIDQRKTVFGGESILARY